MSFFTRLFAATPALPDDHDIAAFLVLRRSVERRERAEKVNRMLAPLRAVAKRVAAKLDADERAFAIEHGIDPDFGGPLSRERFEALTYSKPAPVLRQAPPVRRPSPVVATAAQIPQKPATRPTAASGLPAEWSGREHGEVVKWLGAFYRLHESGMSPSLAARKAGQQVLGADRKGRAMLERMGSARIFGRRQRGSILDWVLPDYHVARHQVDALTA